MPDKKGEAMQPKTDIELLDLQVIQSCWRGETCLAGGRFCRRRSLHERQRPLFQVEMHQAIRSVFGGQPVGIDTVL
jgi:hypothetical protein